MGEMTVDLSVPLEREHAENKIFLLNTGRYFFVNLKRDWLH